MTAITAAVRKQAGLTFGPLWESFEDLRVKYAENLAQLSPGTVGLLKVKKNAYVILNRSDFERLTQTVDEMHRADQDLKVLTANIETLRQLVEMSEDTQLATPRFLGLLRHALSHAFDAAQALAQRVLGVGERGAREIVPDNHEAA